MSRKSESKTPTMMRTFDITFVYLNERGHKIIRYRHRKMRLKAMVWVTFIKLGCFMEATNSAENMLHAMAIKAKRIFPSGRMWHDRGSFMLASSTWVPSDK